MKLTTSLAGALLAWPLAAGAQLAAGPRASTHDASLPLKHAPKPTSTAISAPDLMTRLYIFADDSMMGRAAGTPGNDKGNAYIVSELRRLGLRPAGDSGSYLQTVPMVRRTFEATTPLSVDGQPLALWADYAPIRVGFSGTPRPIDGAGVVYGGVWGDTAAALPAEQVAGKLVVFSLPAAGLVVPTIRPESPLAGAAAVAVVGLEQLPPQYLGYFTSPATSLPNDATPAEERPVALFITRATAERLLGGPLDAAKPGAPGKTVRGTLTRRETPLPAHNVVAILPGTDAKLRGEYVALGAHNDHVGTHGPAVDHDSLRAYNAQAWQLQGAYAGLPDLTPEQRASIKVNVDSLRKLRPARLDSIANGADDDGSGSMGLLEVAEALATGKQKPKRSVLFVWHTAEELGLFGSQYFTDHPAVPRDSIVAQVNIDMIGRGSAADTKGGSPRYLGLVGSRRLSTELGNLVETVNKARKQPLDLDYQLDANGHPENIYCRSDHYNYARYGIPIVFMFTGLHGDYHQVTDEPQYIDYPHYANIVQYVNDLTLRIANMDHRPVVDKPKPDPNGRCQQ